MKPNSPSRIHGIPALLFLLLSGGVALAESDPMSGGPERVLFPADAGVVNVRDHGATGDGKTDDTAALQAAIFHSLNNSIRYGAPRFIYLPDGEYLVSETLLSKANGGKEDQWNGWRAGMNLIGESRQGTVIRLKDKTEGFDDPEQPKAVIQTGSEAENKDQNRIGAGNRAFRHYIANLAIDSGSEVVYLPNGVYFVSQPIVLRGNVRKFFGMGARIDWQGAHDGRPMLRFDGGAAEAVVVEHIRFNGVVEHNSDRALSIRHGDIARYYNTARGTGKLFAEDITCRIVALQHPQSAWLRQQNSRFHFDPWLQNNGGNLWVLGFKSEGNTAAILTTGGGRTELLGGLFYRETRWDGPKDDPLFRVDAESTLSASYVLNGKFYPVQVERVMTRGETDERSRIDLEAISHGRGPGLLRVDPR